MRNRLFTLLALALVLCTASAVIADSQATGALSAKGDGTPRIYMTLGSVQITGNGVLMVSRNAKVTFTTPQKYPMKPEPGKLAGKDMIQYKGFNGTAVVTGEHFSTGMYGKDINVDAKGAGYSILFGTGTYALASDDNPDHPTNGKWTLAAWMPGGAQNGDLRSIEITIGRPDSSDDPAPPTSTHH